jgi:soluble lytic murein transglycosylase-like protein
MYFCNSSHTRSPVAAAPAWPGVATPGALGQPGAAPPIRLGHELRRWAALLALAGVALPGTAAARTSATLEARNRNDRPAADSTIPADPSLPLGDPWEAAVVEPALEPPASPAPWLAAVAEPDGMPLPAAPATANPPATTAPGPGETARGGSGSRLVPPPREYLRRILVRSAQENGLPADLVMALAWRESSWRPGAVSGAGAVGVLQLMPVSVEFTSKELLGLKHALDPRDATANIRMGTRFLRYLVDRSGGDYRQGLIAYNQGITALKTKGSYGEAEAFADSVLALRSEFRQP